MISLLLICGKILERLTFSKILELFADYESISSNQSGFKPGDSCGNHFFFVLLTIFINLAVTPSRQELSFLTYQKACNKVWLESLLRKLKQNGISVHLFNIATDFLSLRKQNSFLNGNQSTWVNTETGFPQGSILGPLFFLIYINHLSDDLLPNTKLFADDTSLFCVMQNINSTTKDFNNDISKISV